jgi:hypothetical protein
MKARLQFAAFLVTFGFSLLALGQDTSSDKQVVDSFKTYVQQHFASYEHNRRERTTLLGGGWAKVYYLPDQSSAGIDVQRTASLVSPYMATLEFKLVMHYTAFHKTRKEAEGDSNFVSSMAVTHKHTYAYQDGKWVPKIRKYVAYGGTYDCDEVVTAGDNAGERDINGCLEEYDNP